MRTIYEPSGRAKEYAGLALNIYNGCSNACEYCFAPAIMRRERADFYAHPQERPGLLDALTKHVKQNPGHGESVLLSFTCDPYQSLEKELRITQQAIKISNPSEILIILILSLKFNSFYHQTKILSTGKIIRYT